MRSLQMVPTSSDTAKFLDGDTFKNSQALAFAVAALQAMPSSSETAEISRVFSSNKAVSPMTMVPLVTKPHETTSEDNAVFLLNAEESLATEQRAGSGTQEGDEEIALESSTKTKPTPAVEAATVFSAAIVEVETEHDAGDRLQRSRERNREHARRTRLRKKAQMQALQIKYKGLLAEKQLLEQKIQDRSIASILLGLSSQTSSHDDETAASFVEEEMSLWEANRWTAVEIIRRKRGSPELPDTPVAPVTVLVNGVPTPISCKTHINWKSGTCSDEQGHQKKLTLEQLETLRRERNRMHAKMTRDRKKCFISATEKAIEELEQELARMRSIGQSLVDDSSSTNAPATDQVFSQDTILDEANMMVTPELTARPSPEDSSSSSSNSSKVPLRSCSHEPSPKRARHGHGFSLDD